MPQNKKNILEKKVPFNLSIKRGVKVEFEKVCNEQEIDKNLIAESLFSEWLKELKHDDYDPTK